MADLRRLNVETTRNLLAALPQPPRKLLLFSSVSAQGVRDGVVVREDTACEPRSPHEIAKYESEREAETWCAAHGVPLAILRPAQVYGPGDVASEIPTMLRLLRLGVFPIFGTGENLMVPLIHVSDVVEMAVRVLNLAFAGTRRFGLTGRQYSVAETASIFAAAVGRRSGWLRVPKRLARTAAAGFESLFALAGAQPPLSRARIDNMTAQRVYDSRPPSGSWVSLLRAIWRTGFAKPMRGTRPRVPGAWAGGWPSTTRSPWPRAKASAWLTSISRSGA